MLKFGCYHKMPRIRFFFRWFHMKYSVILFRRYFENRFAVRIKAECSNKTILIKFFIFFASCFYENYKREIKNRRKWAGWRAFVRYIQYGVSWLSCRFAHRPVIKFSTCRSIITMKSANRCFRFLKRCIWVLHKHCF